MIDAPQDPIDVEVHVTITGGFLLPLDMVNSNVLNLQNGLHQYLTQSHPGFEIAFSQVNTGKVADGNPD